MKGWTSDDIEKLRVRGMVYHKLPKMIDKIDFKAKYGNKRTVVEGFDFTIKIKPMTVNRAWRGRRFKTPQYISYEKEVMLLLPNGLIPQPPYRIYFEFGLSNVLSDWDNPIKPMQDILQKKYGFNDKNVFEASIKKVKVDVGDEYIKGSINTLI